MAFSRDTMQAASQDVLDTAVSVAQQRSAYAGDDLQNAVKTAVIDAAVSAMPAIETAVQAVAITGGSLVAQAAKTADLSALAQVAAATLARNNVIAGLLDPVFGIAQTAAGESATEVASGYLDQLASENRAAQAAAAVAAVTARGRSAPCNSSLIRAGGAVPTSPSVFVSRPGMALDGLITQRYTTDRSNAQFILEVDGKKLDYSYHPYIESVTVYESCEHTISKIKIEVVNHENRFGDDSVWDRHRKINLHFGYSGTALFPRGNTFYSMGPNISYGTGGTYRITIVGYGEEFILGRTEQRRTWINKTDSEIAREIALSYEWDYDIDPTPLLYEHVAQVNESDWKFLDRRARYYGYQVYVDHWIGKKHSTTPILHFHSPRYSNSGLQLTNMSKQDSQLTGFNAWETPLQFGETVVASQVDPLARIVFTVNSQEKKDAVTTKTEEAYTNGPVVTSQTIASLDGKQPMLHMFEEGHRQTSERLQAEAEGFSQSTRWLVNGSGSTMAVEYLHVRDTIELIGVGRDSGEYYIKELTTRIKPKGNTVSEFQLSRTWRGGTKGSRVTNEPLVLTKANQVTVGA